MDDAIDLEADAEHVRTDVGVVAGRRDVVRASGPDATEFLQGQLSQDIAGFEDGGDGWTLLLQPQGRLVAMFRVSRSSADEYLLDGAEGWGQAVVDALERFKLRTRCEFELFTWDWLAYRGPASAELGVAAPIVAGVDWAGVAGLDVVGPGVVPDPSVRSVDPRVVEALRIEAGVAQMGSELDDRTIAAEAGIIDAAVSFTKGCYTGQELVARIDSRGSNTPRRLRGVLVDGDRVPEVGATIEVQGEAVGAITSAAWSSRFGRPVALAFIGRAVEPPASGRLASDGTLVELRDLPLSD